MALGSIVYIISYTKFLVTLSIPMLRCDTISKIVSEVLWCLSSRELFLLLF